MAEGMYSLADIGALMNNRNNNGWDNDMWILVLFFFVFGFGRNGWGNGNGDFTRSDMTEGFNNQSVLRKLDGITQGLCDGFYAVNANNLQMQNQLQRDLCQGFASVNSGISENRFAAQNCCLTLKAA